MKNTAKRSCALLTALAIALSLASCAPSSDDADSHTSEAPMPSEPSTSASTSKHPEAITGTTAVDIGEGYTSSNSDLNEPYELPENAVTVEFALRLLSETSSGKSDSIVISPYSVLSALALVTNGAAGETLSEIETALGMTTSELNAFLPAYTAALPKDEKAKLISANSIWMRDDGSLRVSPSFLQTNADLYGAETYSAPFDETTRGEINRWIYDHTDGLIKEMLKSMPDAVMCLVNAVLFDAEWASPYSENDIREGKFTNANGKTETVDFMYDDGVGFRLDGAVALKRSYHGGTYSFIAVLPDKGITPEEYLRDLDAETFLTALNGNFMKADTAIPKFSISTDTELSAVLSSIGIKQALDPARADFSRLTDDMGSGFYISQVLHNAVITVDECGTKAGAATIISGPGCAAPQEPDEILEIHLDRPFIFFITDTATHTPVFCGIVNSVG